MNSQKAKIILSFLSPLLVAIFVAMLSALGFLALLLITSESGRIILGFIGVFSALAAFVVVGYIFKYYLSYIKE